VGVSGEEVIHFEAFDEGEELGAVEHVAVAGAIAGVVGELDAVHWIDVEAEELEGEDGAFVAHVAVGLGGEGGGEGEDESCRCYSR